MKLSKIIKNKKGDEGWGWGTIATWIVIIAILLFVMYMIYRSRGGITSMIASIFKWW